MPSDQQASRRYAHVGRLKDALAALTACHEARQEAQAARLHDYVLQDLYSMQLSSAHLDAEAFQAHLRRIAEHVQGVVRELQPPSLHTYGLVEALRSLEHSGSGARVHLSVRGVPETPQPADLSLFRIVQEGLANVAAHAGVPEATVSLHQQSDGLTLRVADEGCGWAGPPDFRRWRAEGRYGLTRARLYARAVGGRLTLRSAPGAGTVLSVHVPTFGASAYS